MQRKSGLRPWGFHCLQVTFISHIGGIGIPLHLICDIVGRDARTVRKQEAFETVGLNHLNQTQNLHTRGSYGSRVFFLYFFWWTIRLIRP
jgi:hypothetical protein